jgi:hypothetical protein
LWYWEKISAQNLEEKASSSNGGMMEAIGKIELSVAERNKL